jgi:hypothetical protein
MINDGIAIMVLFYDLASSLSYYLVKYATFKI